MTGTALARRDLLAPFIHGARVDYRSLATGVDFAGLVSAIAHADLSQSPRDEQLAFYLNAYNLLVLHQVLQWLDRRPDWNGAVSLFDKLRFFLFRRNTVAGRRMSLYSLENRIIRARFGDARIHFALNCASRSCPPLPALLFVADELEGDLERLTDRFVNSDEVRYDEGTKTLSLSPIFKWYRRDFSPDVPGFIRRFRDIPPDPDLRFHGYDWRLNRLE